MNPLAWLNPARWLLYAALCAALAAAYLGWAHHQRQLGAAPYIARLAAMQAVADQAAAQNRQIEKSLEKQVKDAENEAHRRAEILQADADAAAAQSRSLRQQLATVRRELPQAAESAVRRYADAASVVLDECQARYQTVAADADRSLDAARTLMAAWPRQDPANLHKIAN